MAENAFLGKGWAFPPRFSSPSSGPVMDDGDALLQQAIHVALHTAVGERPFWPDMGSGLTDFMFADATTQNISALRQEISTVLLNNEPRITLEKINFDVDELYEGILKIELEYIVRQTNSRSNMVFPFYLQEQSI